ncbi:MAG: hypothetical protein R3191_02080 [Anaerolineales bacterium]|nr:hypothetical protein [Anaerolineales bacterium]
MADVYAVFGTLLALGIAFPGMLLAYRLLFPQFVDRAQRRVSNGAGGAFGVGLVGALVLAIPVIVLLALPFGPAKFLGGSMLMASLAFASLGAAGVAAAMGANYQQAAGDDVSSTGAFVRAAVALELAAAFPFLGWFLVIPVMVFVSFGAALGALLGARSNARSPLAEGALAHEPQSA